MEYPPSYKERDLIDPPQDFDSDSKRLIKENPVLPQFGKIPSRPEKKEGFIKLKILKSEKI